MQDLGFTFNTQGQLTERTDGNLSESFAYDLLNRLTTTTIGQDETEFAYLSNGNIDYTTLAGQYNYTTEQPHAVKDVEGPTQEMQQSSPITTNTIFTADNKDSVIDNGTYKKVFTYGPGGGRYRMDSYYNNGLQSSKIYVGNCEFLYDSEGNLTSTRTILSAPTGVFAVSEAEEESTGILHYIHTDYLGSWLKITSNPTLGDPVVENSYSYDAWGRLRNPATWALLPISYDRALGNLNAMQPRFDRGYTGHEELCGFGLINMNGRMYDPYLQRFLSPDNVVSSPDDAQSYNRYTYCLNNPLMYTDPTGWTETTWDPGEPGSGLYNWNTGIRVTYRGYDFLHFFGYGCGHGVRPGFATGYISPGVLGYHYDWNTETYIDNANGQEVSIGTVYSYVQSISSWYSRDESRELYKILAGKQANNTDILEGFLAIFGFGAFGPSAINGVTSEGVPFPKGRSINPFFPGVTIQRGDFWSNLTNCGRYSDGVIYLPTNIGAQVAWGYAQHEYGHYLQELTFPRAMFEFLMFESFMDAMFGEDHDYYFTETDANSRAAEFFSQRFNMYDIHNDNLWPKFFKYNHIY